MARNYTTSAHNSTERNYMNQTADNKCTCV